VLWLGGHLVRRKLLSLAHEAGYGGELVADVGVEVPHRWLVIVSVLDLLHTWRALVLGGVFTASFACVHAIWPVETGSRAGPQTIVNSGDGHYS
jgi:hypothetical protein